METEKFKEQIRTKLGYVEDGDINLDGESEGFIEGYKSALAWCLDLE